MALVLVYGSLLSGMHNHDLLRGAKKVADAEMYGEMYSLGSFPAVIPGKELITGEVYDVPPEVMSRLDRLEGHPVFYRRTDINCSIGEVQTYLYVNASELKDYRKVDSGNWRQYYDKLNKSN